MPTVAIQPQTTWQVVHAGFSLWISTFRWVWPFSFACATINALYDYYNLSLVESVHKNTMTLITCIIFLMVVFLNTAVIDAIHRARQPQASEAFSWLGILRKSWLSFSVGFLTWSMILLGTLLLFIPGIILSIKLIFASYLAIIDQSGIKQSIRGSFALTKQHWWFLANRLTVIALVVLVLFLLGVSCMVWGVSIFSAHIIPTTPTLSIHSIIITCILNLPFRA